MENEDEDLKLAKLQEACKNIGIESMLRVQAMCGSDETEFQYCLMLVIRQLHEHLGLSLAARKVREELMR